jgi:hypothetical protein
MNQEKPQGQAGITAVYEGRGQGPEDKKMMTKILLE